MKAVAIFVEDKRAAAGYRVARAAGVFLIADCPAGFSRNDPDQRSAETGVVRADDLDLDPDLSGFVRRALHYYVPCVVSRSREVARHRARTLSRRRTTLLEDLEILRTVAEGYVAVAIENTLLCQEQAQRAGEMAVLKGIQ
ncbi:MAG: hypothetical protein WKF84_26805 [Pyrinomonadaceae bacterium]